MLTFLGNLDRALNKLDLGFGEGGKVLPFNNHAPVGYKAPTQIQGADIQDPMAVFAPR